MSYPTKQLLQDPIDDLIEEYTSIIELLKSFDVASLKDDNSLTSEINLTIEFLLNLDNTSIAFKYIDRLFSGFFQKLNEDKAIILYELISKKLKKEEKPVCQTILQTIAFINKEETKIENNENEIDRINKLDFLLILTKLIYLIINEFQIEKINYFIKQKKQRVLKEIIEPSINDRKFKKQKKKWIGLIAEDINIYYRRIYCLPTTNNSQGISELRRIYVYDEINNKPGKIYKRVGDLLYKYARNYKDIFYPDIVEDKDFIPDKETFIKNNQGEIYELSEAIFKKRIEGIKIEDIVPILVEGHKNSKKIISLINRNIFYKKLEQSLGPIFYLTPGIRENLLDIDILLKKKKRIEKNEFLKTLFEIFNEIDEGVNRKYLYQMGEIKELLQLIFKDTLLFIKSKKPYEIKLYYLKKTLDLLVDLYHALKIRVFSNEIGSSIFYYRELINRIKNVLDEINKTNVFNPLKSKSLDYFLFGIKIRTKREKIIKGYVEKDFLDYFNYRFKKKKRSESSMPREIIEKRYFHK
jgi:hypothetical protein